MADWFVCCSLAMSVTGDTLQSSVVRSALLPPYRYRPYSFLFRQHVRHAHTPVGLCGNGKRRQITGYIGVVKWPLALLRCEN